MIAGADSTWSAKRVGAGCVTRSVSSILHERVLEYIGCFRRRATSIDEFCRAGVEFTNGGDPGVKLRAKALTTEGKTVQSAPKSL
jgi:hypothetical protein